MNRTVVSYDDLALPYDDASAAQAHAESSATAAQPAMKKQKIEPKASTSEAAALAEEEESSDSDEDMSRALSHNEIWDDSALIDAWESATAEYESYHGKGKSWKSETVTKSPLWYNVPPTKQKSKKSKNAPQITEPDPSTSTPTNGASASADSAPLNFDTFVPTHDPSLNNGAELQPLVHEMPEGPLVGQDEAFQRALNAMYWGGYWTAVYHYQSARAREGDQEAKEEEDVEDEMDVTEETAEGFLPTQR